MHKFWYTWYLENIWNYRIIEMSSIKLLNNQGDEVTIEHSDTASAQGNSVINIKDVTKQVDIPIMYQQYNLK